jgi:outer membrane protein assembly factor BamE
MRKLWIFVVLIFLSTGCVRKMDIEQGNILTPEMAKSLHTGMTVAEVKDILGSPTLLNTFNENRMEYVYSYKPGRGETTEKYILLTFQNDRLKTIQRSGV